MESLSAHFDRILPNTSEPENPMLGLPIEMRSRIFDFLYDPRDIVIVKRTCKSFRVSILETCSFRSREATQLIRQTIKFAQYFHEQIYQLTGGRRRLLRSNISIIQDYVFFQFDMEKWLKVIDSFKGIESACKAEELATECRLDLIEALAEYNIDSQLIENFYDREELKEIRKGLKIKSCAELEKNRFIQKMQLPNLNHEFFNLNEIHEISDILEQAKKTLKGIVFVREVFPCSNYVFDEYDEDPYADVHMINLENKFWGHIYTYYRYRNSYEKYGNRFSRNMFPIDLLIGKKEGDRIVIDSIKGDELKVILRCNQLNHPKGYNFEQVFVKEFLSCLKVYITKVPFRDTYKLPIVKAKLESYHQLIKKFYGEEFLRNIAEELKKRTHII